MMTIISAEEERCEEEGERVVELLSRSKREVMVERTVVTASSASSRLTCCSKQRDNE